MDENFIFRSNVIHFLICINQEKKAHFSLKTEQTAGGHLMICHSQDASLV